jgi:hypothetical protein
MELVNTIPLKSAAMELSSCENTPPHHAIKCGIENIRFCIRTNFCIYTDHEHYIELDI